jgi:hypothetical protein
VEGCCECGDEPSGSVATELVVVASRGKCHYELQVGSAGDCEVIFFLDRIAFASPVWENGFGRRRKGSFVVTPLRRT